jgi:hypothetical protein
VLGKRSSLFCDTAPPAVEHVIEGKLEGRIEVTGRRERGRKQLLDDLTETGGYCKLKRKTRPHCLEKWLGRGCGPVVRPTAERKKE